MINIIIIRTAQFKYLNVTMRFLHVMIFIVCTSLFDCAKIHTDFIQSIMGIAFHFVLLSVT